MATLSWDADLTGKDWESAARMAIAYDDWDAIAKQETLEARAKAKSRKAATDATEQEARTQWAEMTAYGGW